jgi:hypothetical protein
VAWIILAQDREERGWALENMVMNLSESTIGGNFLDWFSDYQLLHNTSDR